MTDLLATIFGVYMLCGGLGLVINQDWAMKILDEMENSASLTFVMGAMILMGGTALILTHNIWTGWPEIMVTLFGWGAAIEGAVALIYPQALFRFARALIPSDKVLPIFGLFTMALGAALILI